MGRVIVKLDEHYLEWSTVVDAPTTNCMTRERMIEYLRDQPNQDEAPEVRVARADEHGSSVVRGEEHWSAWDLIRVNRAGPNETFLTKEQIIELYADDGSDD